MEREALSVGRIVDTALSLADAGGLSAVTMRRLGEALGVEAMSLYHHVGSKEHLIDAVVDRIFAQIEAPSADLPWREALRRRTVSARLVLRRHRWATPLMDTRTRPGPATLGHHDAVLGCLRRGGFSVAGAAHAVAVLDAYLYGFSLQQDALPFETGDEAAALARVMLAQFPTAQYPYLAEIMTEHVLQPGYEFAEEFAWGLDLVLDGLERWLTRSSV